MAKSLMQKLVGILSISLLFVGSLTTFLPAQTVNAADCDSNAVIRCGVSSVDGLKAAYRANQGGNVQALYAVYRMPSEAAFDGMVLGRVTKSGEVWIGSNRVASGAVTAGRLNMPNSFPILNGQFFARRPSVSFRSNSLPAFVKMDGVKFLYGVILSCGNPVIADHVNENPPPPPPQPPTPPTPPVPPTPPQPEKHPSLEIVKDVRLSGDSEWVQQVTADPNERVEFRITVKNTGDTDLTNVRIQDSLPSGVSFDDDNLEGSNSIVNFALSKLVGEGITLDKLEQGGVVELRFMVTVGSDTVACTEPMRNVAFADADEVPEEEDDALVKVCQAKKVVVIKRVKAAQTSPPPPSTLPDTGAAGVVGIFSISSFLGWAVYKLKDFYSVILK